MAKLLWGFSLETVVFGPTLKLLMRILASLLVVDLLSFKDNFRLLYDCFGVYLIRTFEPYILLIGSFT